MLQKAVRYKILHLKSINKNLRSMLLPCKGSKVHRKDSKDFSLATCGKLSSSNTMSGVFAYYAFHNRNTSQRIKNVMVCNMKYNLKLIFIQTEIKESSQCCSNRDAAAPRRLLRHWPWIKQLGHWEWIKHEFPVPHLQLFELSVILCRWLLLKFEPVKRSDF